METSGRPAKRAKRANKPSIPHQNSNPNPEPAHSSSSLIATLSNLVETHQRSIHDTEVTQLQQQLHAQKKRAQYAEEETEQLHARLESEKSSREATFEMVRKRITELQEELKNAEIARAGAEMARKQAENAKAEAEKTKLAVTEKMNSVTRLNRQANLAKLAAKRREREVSERYEALLRHQRWGLERYG